MFKKFLLTRLRMPSGRIRLLAVPGLSALSVVVCLLLAAIIHAAFFPSAQRLAPDSAHDSAASPEPRAVVGVLDLRGWSFQSHGPILLNGQWAFYWNRFLSPDDFRPLAPAEDGYLNLPHIWAGTILRGEKLSKRGIATLRLRILTDPGTPLLGLYITGLTSAYRLFLDDTLLVSLGSVGENREQEQPAFGYKTAAFAAPSPSFSLTLQLSNHHIAGDALCSPTLLLGSQEEISSLYNERRRNKVFLLGIAFAAAVYHLILFLFHRKEISTLYFSIFCFLWLGNGAIGYFGTYLMSGHGMLSSISLVYGLDLLSYFWSIPVFLLFLRSLFPREFSPLMVRLAFVGAGLFSLYICMPGFADVPPLEKSWTQLYHLVSLGLVCWGGYSLVRSWLNGRSGAGLILIGFLLMFLVGLNDILHDMKLIDTGFFMPVGMLLFVVFQAIALARRFAKTFTASEQLAGELQEKNIALSRLDALKDEFLANTSHELRTPLAGIIGITESLLSGAAGGLSDQARHNLQMVVESGQRLTVLINDLLDFSRLRHQELSLQLKTVDIKAVADVVLAGLAPLAQSRQLRLVVDIPAGFPCAHADEDRLQQIFYNLVGNAVKFSDHGQITITARTEGDRLKICVRDEGIGIPLERQRQIFEPFQQVDGSSARNQRGVGLGLAITRNLVNLHKGDLSVRSEPGKGSLFCFTLPMSQKRSAEPIDAGSVPRLPFITEGSGLVLPFSDAGLAARDCSAGASAPRILVVDDEPVNLQVLLNHLTLDGYSVQCAGDGAEGLQLAQDGSFDLVMLDIMMPKMNGYEVCEQLRQRFSPSELPVIMLTARSRVEDIVQGLAVGANDYMAKPFVRDELLARISTQLKLREAYRLVAENLRLKKELVHRRQTELELRQTQQRLAQLLDSVEDAVVTVNESGEISFCNQAASTLLERSTETLLGQPLDELLRGEDGSDFESGSAFTSLWNPLQQESTERDEPELLGADVLQPGDSRAARRGPSVRSLHKLQLLTGGAADQGTPHSLTVDVIASPLLMDDERLLALIIRKPEGGDSDSAAHAAPQSAQPALLLIDAVNRHQERLQGIENTLHGLLPELKVELPELLEEIRSLDLALADMQSHLQEAAPTDRRQLGVQLMQLSLEYWYEATEQDKVALAGESGIWKVYTDRNGYSRTQTLDKYLSEETLPGRPRWKLISNTALYVLAACITPSLTRERLTQTLDRFRLLD